jgi:Zn finger protein HypA/HybF involved in hydrogenase expression
MTQARDPKVVEEFGKRRKRQLWLVVLLLSGLVWLGWVMERSELGRRLSEQEQGTIMIAIVLSAVAFSWRNWRCPACNKYLGKSLWLAFCPACGVPLK